MRNSPRLRNSPAWRNSPRWLLPAIMLRPSTPSLGNPAILRIGCRRLVRGPARLHARRKIVPARVRCGVLLPDLSAGRCAWVLPLHDLRGSRVGGCSNAGSVAGGCAPSVRVRLGGGCLDEVDRLQGRGVLRLLDVLFVAKAGGVVERLVVGDDDDFGALLGGIVPFDGARLVGDGWSGFDPADAWA